MYKTSILKVTDIEPMEADDLSPGSLVRQLNLARKVNEPKYIGSPMRVIQVAGTHVLVNFVEA